MWAVTYPVFLLAFGAGRVTAATAAAATVAALSVAIAVLWQHRRLTLAATPAIAGAVAMHLSGPATPATRGTFLLIAAGVGLVLLFAAVWPSPDR